MAETILHGIRTVGKRGSERKPPDKIALRLRNPGISGVIEVQLLPPGRDKWIDLGLRPIQNGVLDVPLPLAFLCHVEEDKVAIADVGDKLEADGIVIWFSSKPENLAGGADWKAEIDRAIDASDFVIVFLSHNSINKKGYFQYEVKRAFELRQQLPDGERFIIPVLLEECTPPKRFSDVQWIRLYEDDGYERLRRALSDLGVPE